MTRVIITILILLPFISVAQHGNRKESDAKGTVFGYWGYNVSGYTKSNLRFVGPDYDFTLGGAKAHDRPELDPNVYFNLSKITIPQFNARIGYYFKDHWAFSFGYDHMKYIFSDKNEVTLSGVIDENVGSEWSGTYSGEQVITNREDFHYENSDGLNYLRFELTRTDKLLAFGQNDWLAISTNAGVALGGILSFNDFTFANQKDVTTVSLSGYGVSGHASLRFEFFRHVFVQASAGGGFHHQVKVRNRPRDPSAYARQAYGYASFECVLGFLFYIKGKNKCDSCPNW